MVDQPWAAISVIRGSVLSRIVITNDYKWMLDPRYGRMTAYIDHRRAGRIDLGGVLSMEVATGVSHRVRVRLWWYKSPTLTLTLGEDETRTLRADIPRDGSVLANMARGIFKPWSWLRLCEGDPVRPSESRPVDTHEAPTHRSRRTRRGYLVEGLVCALGLTLAAVGEDTGLWWVAAPGFVIAAAGVLYGFVVVRAAVR